MSKDFINFTNRRFGKDFAKPPLVISMKIKQYKINDYLTFIIYQTGTYTDKVCQAAKTAIIT